MCQHTRMFCQKSLHFTCKYPRCRNKKTSMNHTFISNNDKWCSIVLISFVKQLFNDFTFPLIYIYLNDWIVWVCMCVRPSKILYDCVFNNPNLTHVWHIWLGVVSRIYVTRITTSQGKVTKWWHRWHNGNTRIVLVRITNV